MFKKLNTKKRSPKITQHIKEIRRLSKTNVSLKRNNVQEQFV